MITYEYICEENGQNVVVRHSMKDSISTWGDLCALAEIDPGNTPHGASVRRVISGGTLALRSGSNHPLTGSDIRTTNDECVKPVCCGGSCSHGK